MAKNSPSRHHHTTLSGCIFATKACINNWKNLLNSNIFSTCPQQISMGFRLCSVTARHSSSGRQPNFATLNRGRYLYLAGRPSRWALAHILVVFILCCSTFVMIGECVLLLCYI